MKHLGFRWVPILNDDADSRRSIGLAGFAATLLIVLVALVVVRKLQVRCMMENCIMSGASGCQHAADHLRVSRAMDELVDDARGWLFRREQPGL